MPAAHVRILAWLSISQDSLADPVGAGGVPGVALEKAGKLKGIRNAGLFRDLLDRQTGGAQEVSRPFDSLGRHPFCRCLLAPQLKHPVNSGHATVRHLGQVRNGQGAMEVLPDIGFQPEQVRGKNSGAGGRDLLEVETNFLKQPLGRLALVSSVRTLRMK